MDHAKLLTALIDITVSEGASDLHLSAGRNPIIRVSSKLVPLVQQPVLTEEAVAGMLKAMLDPVRREAFERMKEVDFSYSTHNEAARFRCAGYMHQNSVAIAMRLIPQKIRSLEELKLPPILETFANRQQGFFLCVGPVGQGKSTTLAAMIDLINTNRLEHIVTIEDPIEYVFENKKSIIDQREIKIDTRDFNSALTHALRQDVDVIMVGEMRNLETIGTAVTAAETGHLVLSTLHTNSAAQTIERIVDSFPANQQGQIRLQLAGSLVGIFSQRLIPRVAGGLVPAYELLINNTAVANLIREKRVHEINTVIETSSNVGMIDMNRSLAELVRQGEISIENAYQYALNPKMLEKMI